jgi:hypothetical protein
MAEREMTESADEAPLFWLGIEAEGDDPAWSDRIRRRLQSRKDRRPETGPAPESRAEPPPRTNPR